MSPGSTDFRGAGARYRAKGRSRFRIDGAELQADSAAEPCAELCQGDMTFTLTVRFLAIARLDLDATVAATALELRQDGAVIPATAQPLPFDDPEKKQRTAKG